MAGRRGGRRGRSWIGLIGCATLALIQLVAGDARAQNLGAQRFVPASSEDGVLGTEGADRRVPLQPYVSLWMNYALNSFILLDANDDEVGPLVEHLLAADLTFSINVWKGLELGLNLPFTLVREGDDTANAASGIDWASGAALGDLELRVGYRFDLSFRDGLGLYVPVLLPTAADDDPLALGFGVKPTLAYTHGFRVVDLHLNLSVLLREDQTALDYEGGSELGLRVGLRVGLDRTWDTSLLVDLGLVTPFADLFSAAGTPVEPRLGIEHWFNRSWRLTGFLGFGISGGVGTPDLRVGLGVAYGHQPIRPRVHPLEGDRDGDGYSDDAAAAREAAGDGRAGQGGDGRGGGDDGSGRGGAQGDPGQVDECPDEPEDFDGFQDDDGCPDEDNDGDGFDDEDDACPNEPETYDGIADDDGCPDHIRVEGTLITTFEPIRFRTESDELLPESYPILNEVSNVMATNPGMEIRVEGHTDSNGAADYNQTLSQQRAESVRRYLVERGGIAGDRIDAAGFGESRPVADNGTPEGRAMNRRVEFHILE